MYDNCLHVHVNGKVMGDGKHTFNHLFEVCAENLMRKYNKKNSTRSTHNAKKGKGTVGVLMAEYEPTLAPACLTEQQGIRAHLQNCFKLAPHLHDFDEISEDLAKTYELQRADIVEAKEDVLEPAGGDGDPDTPVEPAMKKLLRLWPFLFHPLMMRKHHNRLTGREIYQEMKTFSATKLDVLIIFMTTSSNSNLDNMALRINAEKQSNELDEHQSLMLALLMVANHFGEDSKTLIYNAEVSFSKSMNYTPLQAIKLLNLDVS